MANENSSIIKILITTDNHLGYAEKDPVRANDSFIAFEETLKHAKAEDVDMILLGGDLFHENKPSRTTFHRCTELLRQHCLGSRPCQLEFCSDPTVNFQHSRFPVVNYEDPNINIAMPVFSIHGNHDDPVGQGNLCALDLLSAAGLVNYFGKATNLDEIKITPILLQKGSTKLALYGLGAIRDERLYRLFTSKKVTMLRPREDTEEWFNLFVVHQNRVKHTNTNYLPDQVLDDFLDLVVWGHEHECLIEPEQAPNRSFYITQPGSTVVTSLSEGEAKPKYCSLLQINGKEFAMRKIPLTSTRPFYFENMVLSDMPSLKADNPDHGHLVEDLCKDRIEALIERAKEECSHIVNRQQGLPLIRLRVDHSGGFETFSMVRFGQQFVDKVANPKDLVMFTKKRQAADAANKGDLDFAEIEAGLHSVSTVCVEDMVKEYFERAEDKLKLSLLTERGVGRAVKEYVDKQETDAIKTHIDREVKITQSHLKTVGIRTEEDIAPAIDHFREERKQSQLEDREPLPMPRAYPEAEIRDEDVSAMMDEDAAAERPATGNEAPTSRRRGRGVTSSAAAGAPRGGGRRGRGRGRAAQGSPLAQSFMRSGAKSSNSAITAEQSRETSDYVIDVSDSDDEYGSGQPAEQKRQGLKRGVTYMAADSDEDGTTQPPAKAKRPFTK